MFASTEGCLVVGGGSLVAGSSLIAGAGAIDSAGGLADSPGVGSVGSAMSSSRPSRQSVGFDQSL